MPPSPKLSQTQLAHELGISQALVSLVLNGRRQGINPETYDRIWEHAVRRGYHPKGMRLSSSPAAAKHRSVGIILRAPMRLSSLGNYFGHVQQGLHAALEPQGLSTVFLGTEDELDSTKLSRHFTAGHAFQGVVIFGEVTRLFLNELRRFERRVVVVSARFPGICHSVLGNEPQATEQLVQHLVRLGHRRIGWLGGNSDLGRHTQRYDALVNALDAAGLALNQRYVIGLRQADRAEGGEAAHKVITHRQRRDFPSAFICYNSLMAHGASLAFIRAGLKVPAALSVAGADSPRTDIAEPPAITGAGSNPAKLGEAAARLLLGSTGDEEEPFTDIMLPSQLIVGDSTGPVKAT